MDVVLYLRYSSDRQNEQSIEGQRHVCQKYCQSMGYTIVGEYVDRALTATKDAEKRIEFQKMIRESEKKLWQGVVVYKLDRFARNRYDSATYKARLKKNGVRLISATENISDNPEGIILEAVLEGMAEFYSKELSQKITRGMHECALKGNSTGGQISLGYKIENKKLVVDEHTAPIVRKAFSMYAAGHSVAEICRVLNEAGYRTKTGASFNKNSFGAIFRNKKYIGQYKFMDVVIDGGVPALIDKDTFNKVQERLDRAAKAPARGKALVDYMLSGKVICGHCGNLLTGTASTSKTGRKYFYYTCVGSRGERNCGCHKTPIRKEWLERVVVEDTLELLTPETIDEIADMALIAAEAEKQEKTDIVAIEKEIAEYTKSIERLFKLVENGAESELLTKRLNELEKQRHAAQKRLQQEKASVIELNKPQIVYFLTEFTKGNIDDPIFQRKIIDLLVNSVTVWDDEDDPKSYKFTITYNLSPKKTKTITGSKPSNSSAFLNPASPPFPANTHPYMIGTDVFAINVKHRFM